MRTSYGADKDVDQNRIDYEKAQIKLGDFWHKTTDKKMAPYLVPILNY